MSAMAGRRTGAAVAAATVLAGTAALGVALWGPDGRPGGRGVAGGGDAAIVPHAGIAGVRLGMTRPEVRRVLGPPDAVRPSDLHGGWVVWVHRRRRVAVTFADAGLGVWDVRTTARRHRTAGGAGPGSREPEVRRGLPGATCGPGGGPGRLRTRRVCVDVPGPRGSFTRFLLVGGRTVEVRVAAGVAR